MPFILTDDINSLILQYLRDSGFSHSAFTFSYEAGIEPQNRDCALANELITLIQQGCYFRELEALVDEMKAEDIKNSSMPEILRKNISSIMEKHEGSLNNSVIKNSFNDDLNKNSIKHKINDKNELKFENKMDHENKASVNIVKNSEERKNSAQSPKADVDFDYFKNGTSPDFIPLSAEQIGFTLNPHLDRVNDFCWGSDVDLVTAHDNGTCLCWIIEKSPTGINSRVVHVVEPPKTGTIPSIIRVKHIAHTVNYCCVTSVGTIKVFSYYETICEFKVATALVTSIAIWCDPKIANESFAAISAVDGTCVLRRGINLENIHCIQNFNESICDSSWSKSGVLALSSLDGSFSMLNPFNSVPPVATKLRQGHITCHSWSPINEYLAVASYFYITIFKKLSVESPVEISFHRKEIVALKWTVKDNNDVLFSVDSDSFLYYHFFDPKNYAWVSKCVKLFPINIKTIELTNQENLFLMLGGHDGVFTILDLIKKSIHKCYKLSNDIVDIKSSRSGNLAFRFANGQISVIHSVNIF